MLAAVQNSVQSVSPFSRSARQSAVDCLPVPVLTLDWPDFTVTHANPAAMEALRGIESESAAGAGQIFGARIDTVFAGLDREVGLWGDPNNLPWTGRREIEGEHLEFQVAAMAGRGGRYTALMLTFRIVTDEVRRQEELDRLHVMLDQMPINVMMAERGSLKITYMNKTSADTLRPLQAALPVPVDKVVGSSMDIFHKRPEHPRALLSDPANLPHNAKIKLGDETLDLRVSAVTDRQGNFIGPMVTWSVASGFMRLADDFESNVGGVVDTVSSAAGEMQSSATSLTSTADETNTRANSVATAAEELTASAQEISRQITQCAAVANKAVAEAERSTGLVNGLSEGAQKIGDVVSLIQEIAEQTNLLALNATIEAARAGEAGKGFAVVASEVKALANQTAKATDDIGLQVSQIQGSTNSAVEAIKVISEIIGQISEVTSAISAAVEQQQAATQEVTTNIGGVSSASSETGKAAGKVLSVAGELGEQASSLKQRVEDFLAEVRRL